MDLDDLDDLDAPSHAPSRVSRFAPKSSKLKPRPNSETLDSPAEPPKREGSVALAMKTEPQELKAEKTEILAENGFVKMETEPASVSAAMGGPKEEPEEENASMEVDHGEDTVVREIDVFLNPKIDNDTQLYVFQYPLRPSWRPYELEERCEEVRVKPGSAEVEIDLSLDTDSKNYDQECDSRKKMEKQTLCTVWKVPRTTGYAVGLLMGDKLHLNPIHAVVQLRPSQNNLGACGSKRKNNATADAEATVKPEEPSGKKAAGSSKKQNKPGNSSTEQNTADDDSWVPLKYQGTETESSLKYFKRMVAQESTPLQFAMNPFEYLDSLCPGSSTNDVQAKGRSKKLLLSLPLEDRIKKIFCEGSAVHRFAGLKHIAPDCTTEQILDVLQHHALLVQGLWAPKSSLLFPESKDGALRVARDYVLLLFWKNPVVSCSSLHFPSSLKTGVNKFLNILAVERPSVKNWKFKEQTDISFIKAYPDIVKKQGQFWEDLERYVMSKFGEVKAARGAKNVTLPRKPPKPLHSDKSVAKVTSEAVVGKNIPDDIREALSSKVLPKVIQEHKVCSFRLICQGLRDLALNKLNLPKADARFVKAAEYGTDSPDELRKLAEQIAINIHGLYVLKSSPDHPQYDSFRNVVIDLLCKNGPIAKLKKAEIFDAAKKALNRDVTNNEYSKVMNELCVFKGSFWMLKSGDGNPK